MNRPFRGAVLLTTLCLLLLSLPASAQPRGPKPMSAAERTEQLRKQLDLTDAQAVKIKALFEAQEKEMNKEFGPPHGDPQAPPPGEMQGPPPGPPPGGSMGEPGEMQKKMQDKQKEFDGKISSVLTKEQKKKYDEIQKELRRWPGPPPRREDQ
jgi:Spy/CpxP family protein refolding chaperone